MTEKCLGIDALIVRFMLRSGPPKFSVSVGGLVRMELQKKIIRKHFTHSACPFDDIPHRIDDRKQ